MVAPVLRIPRDTPASRASRATPSPGLLRAPASDPPRVPRARTSRGWVLAHTMIVADSECGAEIKSYLPFARGGVDGPGTEEVSNRRAMPLFSSH